MTVGNLLKKLKVGDQTSIGGRELFTLTIFMDGHGNFLRAQVQDATVFSVGMIIKASGSKKAAR